MNEKKMNFNNKRWKSKEYHKRKYNKCNEMVSKRKKYETQENYYTLCSKIIPRTKLLHKGKKTQKEKMEKRTSKNEL